MTRKCLITALLLTTRVYAEPPSAELVLRTSIPVFAITNTSVSNAVAEINTVVRTAHPGRQDDIVEIQGNSLQEQTFSIRATNMPVGALLCTISDLAGGRLVMIGDKIVVTERKQHHRDTRFHISERIEAVALQRLKLTVSSPRKAVESALAQYGIEIPRDGGIVPFQDIGLRPSGTNYLEVMVTLDPSNTDRFRAVLLLLEEGFRLQKDGPNTPSDRTR
jgi:hypothetical protein